MMKRVVYMLVPILSVLLLLSCGRGKGPDAKPGGNSYLDTLMTASAEKGSKVIDSLLLATNRLEMLGHLSSEEADYCRAVFYGNEGNNRLREYYCRRSLHNDLLYQRNPYYYFKCMIDLVTYLTSKNAHHDALELSFTALDRLKYQEKWMQDVFKGNFLMVVGMCQLKTNLTKEGEATVEQALKELHAAYEADTTNLVILKRSFTAVCNLAVCLSDCGDADKYGRWIDEAEKIFRQLEKRQGGSSEQLDHYRAILLSLRARNYIDKGQMKEAAKAFDEYQRTKAAQMPIGLIEKLDYYMKAQQWEQAAELLPEAIAFISDSEIDPSLDKLSLLAYCYQIARKTGREQVSQTLADTIAALVDSTKLYHQKKDAAELGIIYDTEQKNEEIARQKWENRRQLWTAVGVVLMLIIVFLAFYGRFRRLSAARLRVANDKLHEVNDKLHEANDELQRRHVELQVVHEKAEEASRMKAMFIQQISHEIRTPLNILSGYTQIITMPDVQLEAKERRDMVRKITDNTDRITQLINKMLDLSEAGSQTVIEKTDNVTVAEIAVQAIAVVGIREDPRLDFSLSYTTEQLTPLTTNLRYAIKALVMLLDNAMKFTRPAGDSDSQTDGMPEKKEEVRLIVGASDGFATFTVEDTGCGVPSGEAEHIFEEFVQLNEFYEGTGIGLSVARSIARRLGGDITLDTGYFSGARFVMTLALKNENDINE